MCAISSTSDARIREVQLISLANKLNSLALHLQNIVLTTTATAAVGHTDNLSVIIMANLDGPALFNLFSTGQYSDFTIICKDREFKVHKMVICPNSDFFRAIAKGSFQVKAAKPFFLAATLTHHRNKIASHSRSRIQILSPKSYTTCTLQAITPQTRRASQHTMSCFEKLPCLIARARADGFRRSTVGPSQRRMWCWLNSERTSKCIRLPTCLELNP